MCDLEPIYQKMKARFITTSYKDDSTTGEGIESLIAALRTMSLVFPSECEWIDFSIKKITVFIVENEEAVSPQSKLYFLQTLNEIEAPVAQSAIEALSTSIGDLVSTVAKTKGTYREINETILSNMMGTLNTDTCITA